MVLCVDMNPQFISGLMGSSGSFWWDISSRAMRHTLSHQRVNTERKRQLKRNVPSRMKTADIVNPVILDTTANYVLIQTQCFMKDGLIGCLIGAILNHHLSQRFNRQAL